MKLLMVVLLTAVAATGVGCGYSSHATMPQQPGTMPAIAALVPPSTAAGSSTFTLEVDGSNFGSKAVVNFNGAPMTTTFVSSTKVTATIPASAVATKNSAVPVTVTNPGTPGGLYGGGTAAATSTPMNFTIN
jgi:IPT/TIG domain